MIIEIPDENSIVKWKNNDKDEWKSAEISDLIKAYERPQGEWINDCYMEGNFYHTCNRCNMEVVKTAFDNFCPNCGALMREV